MPLSGCSYHPLQTASMTTANRQTYIETDICTYIGYASNSMVYNMLQTEKDDGVSAQHLSKVCTYVHVLFCVACAVERVSENDLVKNGIHYQAKERDAVRGGFARTRPFNNSFEIYTTSLRPGIASRTHIPHWYIVFYTDTISRVSCDSIYFAGCSDPQPWRPSIITLNEFGTNLENTTDLMKSLDMCSLF